MGEARQVMPYPGRRDNHMGVSSLASRGDMALLGVSETMSSGDHSHHD